MNIEQFVTLWVKSRLCGQYEADEAVRVFKDTCDKQHIPARLGTFCGFLISTNRITEWQCDKLRMGKWKGFYLDNYLILEHVGKDYSHSYYKARDTRDGKLVRMAVTPIEHPPYLEYSVGPYSDLT